MSDKPRLDDDVLLDRLVDGHLSGDERRRLLEALDDWPAGWRRCAMAFLEAQSWGQEFKLLAHSPAESLLRERLSAPAPGASHPVTRAETTPTKPRTWPTAMRWMSVAASLMLAFFFGVSQREKATSIASISSPADEPGQIVTLTPPPADQRGTVRNNDALTLWVRDDRGQRRQVRVPLVDAGTLDREYGVRFRPAVPNEVSEHLRDRGYQVESQRRYAPIFFEDGRSMILPVEDTKIVPFQ